MSCWLSVLVRGTAKEGDGALHRDQEAVTMLCAAGSTIPAVLSVLPAAWHPGNVGSRSYFGRGAFLQSLPAHSEWGREVCAAGGGLNAVVWVWSGFVFSWEAAHPVITLPSFLTTHGCLSCLVPKGAGLAAEPEGSADTWCRVRCAARGRGLAPHDPKVLSNPNDPMSNVGAGGGG